MKARLKRLFGCEEDVIGLDINYGRVVAAHFSNAGSGFQMDRLAAGEFPVEFTDQQLAKWLRVFWKKEKLPGRTVRTCLHSRSLIVRYFNYKNLTTDELAQTLRLEAEEALQKPANELCFDWHVNPVETARKSVELSGFLAAVPRKTITRHLNLMRAAGLYSIHVEIGCSALYNFYTRLRDETDTSPVCLINLADRTADIIMLSNSGIYPRTLFSANDSWDKNLGYLMENIQNALLYYHLKTNQHPMEKIVLIGRIPDKENFSRTLAKNTALPVNILNPGADPRIAVDRLNLSIPETFNVATGIGLALGGLCDETV
ncbi:MAG TPA: pilus assembly protein PilM [Pontiellaceae bacterium]|nr:pilus assembly protein PilM [Pontiellaceae bacterium]